MESSQYQNPTYQNDASKKGTIFDSNTSNIGGGFELENYTLKSGGKFLFAMIFLCSLAGLSLLGIWTFAYGPRTKDITQKVKDPVKHEGMLLAGSILTVLSSIVFLVSVIRLHNEKEKEV